jgi:hypothetical protein
LDIIDAEVEDDDTWHQPLIAKYERYRGVLKQAAESDAVTATAWEEWEEKIQVLAQDEVCYSFTTALRTLTHLPR